MSCAGWRDSLLGRLLILAPLGMEVRALRRGVRSGAMVRTGMGPEAATRAGRRVVALAAGGPVAVAGFCGGLRPEIRTGDVIVASEVRGPGGVVILPSAPAVAEALRSAGLTVHLGPMVSSDRVAFGSRRARAAADGSIGVDMESYWLLEDYAGPQTRPLGPAAVVRAVSDTVGERFFGGMLPTGWLRAYRSLARVGAALQVWADGLGPSI
jgi:4-hydroxy-3-methylbut-2-en-1-yl diphosphate reductase